MIIINTDITPIHSAPMAADHAHAEAIDHESLAWDIDFKTKVTRSAFESVCTDLKGQFAKPIEDGQCVRLV